MRWSRLTAVLSILCLSACGESNSAPDAQAPLVDSAIADAAPAPVDASSPDASIPDGSPPDASVDAAPVCDCAVGEFCDLDISCQAGPAPLGGHCGPTPDCLITDPDAIQCHNEQCQSNNCARVAQGVFVPRDTCTQGCTIYQDDDGNGVNDADAPMEDCQPAQVGESMFGAEFRCVNFSPPQNQTFALCVPGSDFVECASNADCPAEEACELSSIQGFIAFRCLGRYVESGGWGHAVVRLGEACNDDPTQGALAYCQDGSCEEGLCSAVCSADEHCDTSEIHADHRCVNLECENAPGTACTVDSDCSTMECGGVSPAGGGLPAFQFCTAKP